MLRVTVIVFVFLGAIFVFLSRQPEQVFARSADGVVTFESVSSRVHSVSIESNKAIGVTLEPRVSMYYSIIPDLAGVKFSGSLSVEIVEQWKQSVSDPTELMIYEYRGPEKGWTPLLTEVDLSTSTLHAQVDLSEPLWIAVGTKL